MQEGPLISIVTVCYQDAQGLRRTLQSVAAQAYPHVEHIVVDGGSSDGTRELLEQQPHPRLAQWVSEPDQGIYDAMNKGVRLARGTFVNFMNAGDAFADPQAIASIFAQPEARQAEVVYGDHLVDYGHFRKHKHIDGLGDLWKAMTLSHQSVFARRSDLLAHPFRHGRFRVAADYDYVYGAYCRGLRFFHAGVVVALFEAGGLSDVRALLGYREVRAIVRERGGSWAMDLYHRWKIAKHAVVRRVASWLPRPWAQALMRAKYRLSQWLSGRR
jgi:glycosyltransferase involved in cell wall biosynthesis